MAFDFVVFVASAIDFSNPPHQIPSVKTAALIITKARDGHDSVGRPEIHRSCKLLLHAPTALVLGLHRRYSYGATDILYSGVRLISSDPLHTGMATMATMASIGLSTFRD